MASPVRSGMTLGDVRHTEQDYQNPNMLRLRVPTNSVQMDANELDREYKYNMNKVGLEGVNTMERMAKSKLEQKSLQSGLANMRRAFEPYDHDHTGECTPEVLRKALEVFGLQFTEEQVMALCGCYDKGRTGVINWPKWMQAVSLGKHCTRKAWDSCMEWADREAKWAQLEQKWEEQMDQHGGQPNNSDSMSGSEVRAALSKVYDRFFQVDARGWSVPGPKQVLQWMREAGFGNTTVEQARRVVFQLDPCDREEGVMSLDEFVAWWDLSQQGTTAVLVSKDVISEKEPQPDNNAIYASAPAAKREYTPYWAI